MITKVQSWGNSQGLRLNRQVLEEAHISVGEEVDLVVQDGLIVISPAKRVRGNEASYPQETGTSSRRISLHSRRFHE